MLKTLLAMWKNGFHNADFTRGNRQPVQFTHTGVEMSDYVTNIAFENKSALPLLTISLKTLRNVTHSIYVSVAF